MADTDIWNFLNKDLFFFKNSVAFSELKTGDKWDIYDPAKGELLVECREPDLGGLTKAARLLGGKYDVAAAFNSVAAFPNGGRQVLRVERRGAVFTIGALTTVVTDHNQEVLGEFKKKALSLHHKFEFLSTGREGNALFEPRVSFLTGDVKLFVDGILLGHLTRKWKKDGSEFFKKEKCRYALEFLPELPKNDRRRQILLAFAMVKDRITR